MAVTTHTAVVTILDPTLNKAFIFSFDFILSSLSVVSSGFDIEEVNIWDSSPGRDGFMDRMDSIVTFNYFVSSLSCLLGRSKVAREGWRDRGESGLTGRVHNPNFVIGLITIIHSANKLSVLG